jgi:putative transposase
MPRTARIVLSGEAHHVTQRGNRRMQTFFRPEDYVRYIDLVAEGCAIADVEVLAYCLMPNHVHLILVPSCREGLTDALASAHQRYTWAINRREGWQGHLWQQRFHSCPMDEKHAMSAIRYVELNPVRARLAASPDLWPWSSTVGRCSGMGDKLVRRERPAALAHVEDWLGFLGEGLSVDEMERLRLHRRQGLPLGSLAFVAAAERAMTRLLRPPIRGRPCRTHHPRRERSGDEQELGTATHSCPDKIADL